LYVASVGRVADGLRTDPSTTVDAAIPTRVLQAGSPRRD